MAISTSLGFARYVNLMGSAKEALEGASGFYIHVYGGVAPADATAAATGNLLLTFTESGDGTTGLTFEDGGAATRNLVNTSTEDWTGTVGTTGTATHFRLAPTEDDGLLDDGTKPRLQGTVSDNTDPDVCDFFMADPDLVELQVKTIAAYTLSLYAGG